MYKIAVLGDRDSVLGFKALGLETFDVESSTEARKVLAELAERDYAIIYITENLTGELSDDIKLYDSRAIPAIIPIPGRTGTLGIGMDALNRAVERAVGVNILNG